MRILLILVISTMFGCATGSFPAFPDVKDHYVLDVAQAPLPEYLVNIIENMEDIPRVKSGDVANCLKFDIVSTNPYKIKFNSVVPLVECSGVGGYKPSDSLSIYNWMQDVLLWADNHKKCFK